MRHIYKSDGPYKKGDASYDCKCINSNLPTPADWFDNLEEAVNTCEDKPIAGELWQLKLQAESLGIKFRSNTKLETLKAKIEEAKAVQDDT